jgi:hypothetical protein
MNSKYLDESINNFDRVRNSTNPEVNQCIDDKINQKIDFYTTQPRSQVENRITELEKEWDVERVLEVNASTLALTGLLLGATVNKKWFALPAVVLPFLLQHGLQGWCPPLPILRRLGVRTRDEIDREKYALKQIIGA